MIISASSKGLDLKGKTAQLSLNGGIKIGEFEITGPGEFEISGTSIVGTPIGEGTLYNLQMDDMGVLFPVGLTEVPTDEQLDQLMPSDILIVEAAPAEVVSKLIQKTDVSQIVVGGNADVEKLKLSGATKATSLKIDKRSLPEGEPVTTIITF